MKKSIMILLAIMTLNAHASFANVDFCIQEAAETNGEANRTPAERKAYIKDCIKDLNLQDAIKEAIQQSYPKPIKFKPFKLDMPREYDVLATDGSYIGTAE